MQIIELLTPHYEAAWLPWAVQYFFLVGMATGAALLASWGTWAAADSAPAKALPLAIVLLAVTAVAAPVSLLADLHQPARFWHFYAHFTPWSWMSLGALLLPLFVGLSVALCAAWWLGKHGWMRLIAAALVVSALTIVAYTGAEIAVVRARPLWSNPWVPVNLALTAWLAAVGAMLILSLWVPAGRHAKVRAWLGFLGGALSLALLAVAGIWMGSGITMRTPSFLNAMHLYELFPVWRISLWLSVVLGVLVLLLWFRPQLWLHSRALSVALGVAVCAAAWGFRWALFMGVQGVPKYGAGLYVYHMPLGGDGLMGVLGVFGLCIALTTLVLWALELWPGRHQHALPAASA
ncbi:NrfD/PsrC family molybdoenzyme membrane anchor subunit [Diaphorobacter caeni]|uniref:NrfD/PsrC family molybdoenzyme membrane anchor subunit n=1 Tax=Diaphorobacter caeni TaxID=2784387 RepID=UPI00188DCE9F|nr:NrfD/PsrC family molybdoenzyme membrane anchor subunit [Diaphorobacter caeni]MBF5005836.1 polysulfide reductase NrfD [Diaphorobacter caeni]